MSMRRYGTGMTTYYDEMDERQNSGLFWWVAVIYVSTFLANILQFSTWGEITDLLTPSSAVPFLSPGVNASLRELGRAGHLNVCTVFNNHSLTLTVIVLC